MGDVSRLPVSETLTAEQTIAEAARHPFRDVIVIGYVGDELFWRTSRMTNAQALYLIELMKIQLMTGGAEG